MDQPVILKEHLAQVVHMNQIKDLIQKKLLERIPVFLDQIKTALLNGKFELSPTADEENTIKITINGVPTPYETAYIYEAYKLKSGFENITIVDHPDSCTTDIFFVYPKINVEDKVMKVVQDGIKQDNDNEENQSI